MQLEPVDGIEGESDRRQLNHLADEEIQVDITIKVGCVIRETIINACVQSPSKISILL